MPQTLTIIISSAVLIVTIFIGIALFLMLRFNKKQNIIDFDAKQAITAARELKEHLLKNTALVTVVKDTLDGKAIAAQEKLEDLSKIADLTNTLVNGSMEALLQTNYVVLKRIAFLTGEHEDMAAAAVAKEGYTIYQEKLRQAASLLNKAK